MKRLFFATAVALDLAATAILGAGQGPGAASDRLTADVLKGIRDSGASDRRWPPGVSSTSRSIRRTRTSGTWRAPSAASGRPSIAASPSRRSSTTADRSRCAASPSTRRTRTCSSSAPARATASGARTSATASTSRSDAGATWKRVGLATSEHIGKILIDPRNSNIVYVASQGPLWSPGGERGLYKTDRRRRHVDGGADHQPRHGHQRHRVRPEEPRHHVRLGLPAAAGRRPDDRRRAGRRHLQDDQRGQDLDEADQGPAEGRHGTRRVRRRRPQDAGHGVRHRRRQARRSGILPLGRRRHDVGAHRAHGPAGPGPRRRAGGGQGRRCARNQPRRPRRRAARRQLRRGRAGRAPAAAAPRGAAGAPPQPTPAGATAVDDWYRGGGAQVLPRDLRRPVPAGHDLLDERQRRAQHGRRQDVDADRTGRTPASTSITIT